MLDKDRYVCPVCRYDELTEPAYDDYGCSSFSICPCCGIEFGYDDHTDTHAQIRQKWVEAGMKWWSTNQAPPAGWNPILQLKKS